MGRILVRSGMSPFDVVPYDELEAHIGGNVGNLIYAYGVFRMLSADGATELVSTNYRLDYTPEEIARFNEEFDCFVIPLADAIRKGFAKQIMPALTRLVKALRIPCVVIGIGLDAPYEPGKDFHFPFDGVVRDFLAAVLEKSAIVGLRGEITGEYLSRLGFRAESDFTVIGCPSMYTYGEELAPHWDAVEFNPETRVSFCMTQRAGREQIGFIRNNVRRLRDAVYIPQRGEELRMMRTGQPYLVNAPAGYPVRITDELIGGGYFLEAQRRGSTSSAPASFASERGCTAISAPCSRAFRRCSCPSTRGAGSWWPIITLRTYRRRTCEATSAWKIGSPSSTLRRWERTTRTISATM